ncbi:MAG: adenosine kinase, partial [Acidimicrobiales bacterium]|nr:adenosine kinase [Acidimicrobiales bacterium]
QVTPDAERTLNTFLGISAFLDPIDVDEELVADSSIVYCEGYLWDTEPAKAAIRGAMSVAREAGRQVSLTLSDGFCVERHRDEWLALIGDQVDILFGNEDELRALYQTDDLDEVIASLRTEVEIGAVTLGKQGSIIVAGDQTIEVGAEPIEKVVDTTGAGDLYSSGFLFGLSTGRPLAECGRLASMAASEVISHVGARPQMPLSSLL